MSILSYKYHIFWLLLSVAVLTCTIPVSWVIEEQGKKRKRIVGIFRSVFIVVAALFLYQAYGDAALSILRYGIVLGQNSFVQETESETETIRGTQSASAVISPFGYETDSEQKGGQETSTSESAGLSDSIISQGETTALQESESGSEYIFEDSQTRLLTEEEVQGLTDWELQAAINEIYARHHALFSGNAEMQAYFDGLSWYTGSVQISEVQLNEIENANVNLLVDYQLR